MLESNDILFPGFILESAGKFVLELEVSDLSVDFSSISSVPSSITDVISLSSLVVWPFVAAVDVVGASNDFFFTFSKSFDFLLVLRVWTLEVDCTGTCDTF